jgi:hypothetical protein
MGQGYFAVSLGERVESAILYGEDDPAKDFL